jgi:hypothetical protein
MVPTLLLASALLFRLGYGGNPFTLLYIFPNGFRGMVKIEGGKPNGVAWSESGGVVKLTVPPSGVLQIRDRHLPEEEWHRTQARYQDGTPILVPDKRSEQPEKIALRSLDIQAGTNGATESWLVLGSVDDLKKGLEKVFGFPLPIP